jgi:hypothetical protein
VSTWARHVKLARASARRAEQHDPGARGARREREVDRRGVAGRLDHHIRGEPFEVARPGGGEEAPHALCGRDALLAARARHYRHAGRAASGGEARGQDPDQPGAEHAHPVAAPGTTQ